MYRSVYSSDGKRVKDPFKDHMRQQWTRLVDAGHDTIAGWKDRSARTVHATYGVTKVEADLQVQELERIRRGYGESVPDGKSSALYVTVQT